MADGDIATNEARRATLYLSWAGVMACMLASAGDSSGLMWRPWLALGVFDAACLGLLLMRPNLPRRASLVIFPLEVLIGLAAFWVAAEAQAASGRPFSPFTGYKIVALLVAILPPSMRLGT